MTTSGAGRRLLAVALCAALLLLAGCRGGEPAAVRAGGVCTGAGSDPIELATAPDVSSSKVRNLLYQEWDRLCPRHPVRLVQLPLDADGQRSQLVAAEQSGNAGYDVLSLDVTLTAEFASGGLIRPLDGEPRGDFLDAAWQTVDYRGRVWAVPFNSDVGLLFYRTDAGFSGAPATWDDLEHDVGVSTFPAQHGSYVGGYITQLAPYEGLTVNALEAIWDAQGDLVGPDGTVSRSNTAVLAVGSGLEHLRERFVDLTPQKTVPALSAHESESLHAFEQGQVIFMRGWSYMYGVLTASGLKSGSQFDVAPLPGDTDGQGHSALGGQNLAVAAHSRHPELARQLIDFLTSAQSERCLLEGGFTAARTGAYSTADDAPRCPLQLSGPTGDATAAARGPEAAGSAAALPPYHAVLLDALSRAKPRPVTPYYAAFTRLVQEQVTKILRDGSAPSAATVDTLVDGVQHVLAGKD